MSFSRLIFGLVVCLPAFGGWGGHVQGNTTSINGVPVGQTTEAVTLASNPTTGNSVMCSAASYNNGSMTVPTVTFVDGNSNSYTVTSQTLIVKANGVVAIAWLLNAPSNAHKTITATWSIQMGGYGGIACDEFTETSCTAALDTAIGGSGTAQNITSPTITVGGSSEIVYSGVQTNNSVSGVSGAWTKGGDGTTISASSFLSEWINTVSTNTAVGYTGNFSSDYSVQAASFSCLAASSGAKNRTLLGVGQ